MRCGQRRTKPLDEEKHWNFFLVCTWNRCDIEDEGVARREETRPCASRHPVHVYIVYISSRRPCPDLAPFLARRKRMEHRLSHERRAGYKGTAGPPLNTPSAGSLAPRHENSCVFPPSLLVRPLRQSGVRYGVGRRCQKKLNRAESGGFMWSREALWVVHHSHSFSFSSSGERTGTGDTSAPPAWRKVGKDERHLNPV